MKVYPGFSCYLEEYKKFIREDGQIETDELDQAGLAWEWNDGQDGPVLAGKGWLPTISVRGTADND